VVKVGGACNEIQAHLGSALTGRHISASERASLCERFTIVGKQLVQRATRPED